MTLRHVRMPDSQWEELTAAADEDEVSISDEVRDAIAAHLRARRARKARGRTQETRPHTLAS